MTNSRAVTSVQENHFSSNYFLESNHDIVGNQFDMSHDHLVKMDNDEVGNNSDLNLTQNDELYHTNVLHIAA